MTASPDAPADPDGAVRGGGDDPSHRPRWRSPVPPRAAAAGQRVVAALGSVWGAVAVVAVFTGQAALLAVTMRQSNYDEPYHLVAIRYFASGGSPFGPQPPSLSGVGDVERYGSYLYHLLMSVPWRLTAGLPEETRVAGLRLLTVLLVAGALLAIRRLGRRLGLSGLAANLVVLVAAAVPMTTFLAVTVNYDNLVFLLLPLMWLAALRLVRAPRLDGVGWALFLMAAGALALSKFSALPFVAVTGVWVLVQQARAVRRRPPGRPVLRFRPAPLAAAAGALLAVALVVERYGVNLLRYRAVQPDCEDVQPVDVCMTWGPWARNAVLDEAFPDQAASLGGLVHYVSYEWLPRLMSTWTLFPVATPEGQAATFGPHVLGLVLVGSVLGVLALVLLAPRRALGAPGAVMLLVGCGAYLAALLVQNYGDYRILGEPVAVQGRYLQLLLAPMLVLAARALSAVLAVNGRRVGAAMRVGGALVLIVALTQSAGLLGVLSRSAPEWFRESRFTPAVLWVREVAERVVVSDEAVREIREYAR